MGLSKTQRILLLLAIDSAFFLLELIVGYAVHSLALVADAFHMLNDVLSLCVGLWAVRIANTGSSKMYTYGWQRAETLGALVNGVFLVALCLSIFLEAIQRFVEPQVVSNPKLVLIVGCFGLASNVLGLFLFHEHGHGHSHGGQEDHSHGDEIKDAEEGHAHTHSHDDSHTHERTDQVPHIITEEDDAVEDIPPGKKLGASKKNLRDERQSQDFTKSDEDGTTVASVRTSTRKSIASIGEMHHRRRRTSGSFGRGFGSVDNLHIHPASFRNDIIQAARVEQRPDSELEDEEEEALLVEDEMTQSPVAATRTLSQANGSPNKRKESKIIGYGTIQKQKSPEYEHDEHNHNKVKDDAEGDQGGHGHSHGDLNMRGVFLHVMGDALGNIGVIGSALFIWLTNFSWRYYVDPAISLIITVIILTSAIPLCKAASRILLQAVPVGMSIDEITDDIEKLPRVIEAHHLHVWQLSDTKLVASLHVKVDCEIEGSGSASYMHLAREIRRCLHGYGIHSSTIQPEFFTAEDINGVADQTNPMDRSNTATGAKSSKIGSPRSESCLLDCGDNCGSNDQCCPPDTKNGKD